MLEMIKEGMKRIQPAIFVWIGLNLLSFLFYGLDKHRAIRKKRRIRNRTLLGLAGIGGAPGALLGMFLFHHKVSQTIYRIGVPFFFLLQIFFIYAYLVYFQ